MAFRKVITLMLVVAVILQANAKGVNAENMRGCLRRTGLQPREILTINHRNGKCSVDCATKQTTVLTYFKEDGSPCEVAEHQCFSEIISARVPDLDQSANGDTDAFVVVSMAQEWKPYYKKDDILCHTFIVQDNDRPVWRFKCLDIPIPKSAYIKLTVYDADPARAEFIGSVVYGIEYLAGYNSEMINVPLFRFESSQEQVGSLQIRPFVSPFSGEQEEDGLN